MSSINNCRPDPRETTGGQHLQTVPDREMAAQQSSQPPIAAPEQGPAASPAPAAAPAPATARF